MHLFLVLRQALLQSRVWRESSEQALVSATVYVCMAACMDIQAIRLAQR